MGFKVPLLALLSITSCSSMPGHYHDILPGMHSEEVEHDMGEPPARIENTPHTLYTSWYWGQDEYCVLFENDKTVSKAAAVDGKDGQPRRPARCPAPVRIARSSRLR